MTPVKRLEIVVDVPHSVHVTDVLARHGLTGWSIVRNVTGAGERGHQFGDDLTGVSSNHMIVTTCAEGELPSLAEDLRRLLDRIGGICLVSDAHWLRV
jgi:hypothetical protein